MMADDIPQITLPDVNVTPDNPPPQYDLAEQVGLVTGGALDLKSMADQVAPLDQISAGRIAQHANADSSVVPPLAPLDQPMPGVPATNLPQQQREQYADDLMGGQTDGSQDWAERLLGRAAMPATDTEENLAQLTNGARSVAAGLPDHDELDAYSGYLATNPMDAPVVKQNLLDAWSYTGRPIDEIVKETQGDPMLQDAIRTPDPIGHALSIPWPLMPMYAAEAGAGVNGFAHRVAKGLGAAESDMMDMIVGSLQQMQPKEYLKSEDRFLNGEMSAPEAAGFITMHMLPGAAGGPRVPGGVEEPGRAGLLAQAKAAMADTAGSLGRARSNPGIPLPAPAGMAPSEVAHGIWDDLNRLRTRATADKVTLLQDARALPPEWLNKAFQEKVSGEVETRMTGTPEVSPETQEFLDAVKPLTDKQMALASSIRERLNGGDAGDPSLGIKSVDEGYVHRVVDPEGSSLLDPATQRDVITGGTPRTLSTFAAGLQARSKDMYVLENKATGERSWGQVPLSRAGYEMGDTVKSGITDDEWTVKPPTMAEAELNAGIKYQKNFLANMIENVARLGRVDRNLDFLQNQAKELKAQGLFEPLSKDNSFAPPVPGMLRVELPQMQGWANPKIANVLNDFFNQSKGDLDGFLTRANRFLMSSLFVSPVVHAGNVGAHWAVGRGWDWIKPAGYGSLARDGVAAVREVWNQGPRYIEHLNEGSGLMYANTQTENFYNLVQHKLFNEQMGDPAWTRFAKTLGFGTVKDLVQAEYKASRSMLWMMNDVFLLQRQFELERKGLPVREAIAQSERDIPNYRVPPEVLGMRKISELLQSPNWVNFGRYKYGQISAIGNMVHDMVGPGVTGAQRFDALGKATVMAAIGLGVYPLLNTALRRVSGNPDAEVRPFGPFALTDAAWKFASGQKDWAAAISSFASLAPMLDLAGKIRSNRDTFGRPIINDKSTAANQVASLTEAGINEFYPGQLLLQALKPGGVEKALGSLIGMNLGKKYVESEAQQKREQGIATSHDRNDPFMKLLGTAPPPASGYPTKGSFKVPHVEGPPRRRKEQ
jgi:hypothetical protein